MVGYKDEWSVVGNPYPNEDRVEGTDVRVSMTLTPADGAGGVYITKTWTWPEWCEVMWKVFPAGIFIEDRVRVMGKHAPPSPPTGHSVDPETGLLIPVATLSYTATGFTSKGDQSYRYAMSYAHLDPFDHPDMQTRISRPAWQDK